MITRPKIYTEEFVLKELEDLLEKARNEKLLVIGELFEDKPYSQQRFSEWAEEYKDNEQISESIKRVKTLFENRINRGALLNKLNPTMSIFNLKNNYGWKDRTETDITSGDKPIPLLNGITNVQNYNSNQETSEPHKED